MSAVVCGVGPAVLDQRVLADAQVLSGGGKTEVRIQDALGGGCLNALRAAAQQRAAILPVLLVGLDPLRRHIEMLLKQQFPQSILLSMLRKSRRSILCGDSVATVRSAMVCQRLPESAQRRLRAADLVIVTPMTEQDTQFVAARPDGRLSLPHCRLAAANGMAESGASFQQTWPHLCCWKRSTTTIISTLYGIAYGFKV